MYKILMFAICLLFSSNVWAMDPIEDFSTNKGVGEASLRVLRSLEAPNNDSVEMSEPQAIVFSEQCGILGCSTSYLVYQTFSYSDIKSGSVAALVSYDVQGNNTSIKVIAE